MDKTSPAASGETSAAKPLTSQTVNLDTLGQPIAYETIKVNMPGSGMVVFNRYKLVRILGRGGMGVVWLADDQKLERHVALKFLPSLIGLDPGAVKELKTETRRGLELSHPNIVRIYDFVDDEDAAAISMEFVDGKTLSELRATTEHGVFTVEQITQWLPGVCDALDYAHFQRKLVHRDLKPANIMITSREQIAKVADFGIARSLSDTMSRLSAAHIGTSGTLPYMSPQQAMGERPLPTDDVYSLGATIYELLAGKPPFYRGDLPTQIRSKTPPMLVERRQELELAARDVIPREWEEAIAACLNKDPTMRPSCAGLLAEMLGIKPATVTSRTYSPGTSRMPQTTRLPSAPLPKSGPAAAPVKKKSMAPALLLSVIAVLAIGGVAGMFFAQQGSSKKVAGNASKSEVGRPAPKPEPPAPQPSPAVADPGATTSPSGASATPPVVASVTTPVANPVTGSSSTTPGPGPSTSAETGDDTESLHGPPAPPTIGSIIGPQATSLAPLPVPVAPDTQPDVEDPEKGYWTLDQIFPSEPFATYSAPGRKHILYRAQQLLKEERLLQSTPDGKEGEVTHIAIMAFQGKSGLKATGMLDNPTLKALRLADEPDKIDWVFKGSSTPKSTVAARSSDDGEDDPPPPRSGGSRPRIPPRPTPSKKNYAPQEQSPGGVGKAFSNIKDKVGKLFGSD